MLPVEQDGLVRRVARFGMWSVVGHVATAAAAFGVSIIVARSLGPDAFGRYSYFLWLLRFVPVVLALGVPMALTKLVAEQLGAGDEHRAAAFARYGLRWHVLLAPIAGALTGVVVLTIEDHAGLAWAMGAGVALTVFALDFEALLPTLRRFQAAGLLAVATSVVMAATALLCAALDASWEAYVAVQTLTAALLVVGSLALCAVDLRREPDPPLAPGERREFIRYAGLMSIVVVINAVLWGRPELFFLDRYRSDADVGLYSAALRISSLAAMLPVVAAQAVVPEFARLRGAGADREVRDAYPNLCRMLALFAAPFAFGGAAVAGPFLDVLYGVEFEGAANAAVVLFVGAFVNAVSMATTAAVLTGPRPRLIAEAGVVTAIVNLVVAVLVIPAHGVIGAALVNCGIQLFCIVFACVYVWHWLGLRYPIVATMRTVFAAGVAAFASWQVGERLDGAVALVAGSLVFLVAYAILVLVTGAVTRAELSSFMPRRHAAVD